MDVVILFNGLGNQMSQYAFYLKKKSISKSTRFIFSRKSKRNHNGYELENVFGIKYQDTLFNKILFFIFLVITYRKIPILSKPINRIINALGISFVHENEQLNVNWEHLKPSRGIKFYVGGFTSEKYIVDIKEAIFTAYHFNLDKVGEENLAILKKIRSVESVSVHVRRGDFLDAKNYHKYGAICTLNYFLRAIEEMKALVNNPHFFFFTNDYEWVKQNFSDLAFTIININTGENSWKDMFLISNCRNHINSNGSFSWWSTWLNRKPGKIVITPKYFIAGKYFEDVYPDTWIQLEDY